MTRRMAFTTKISQEITQHVTVSSNEDNELKSSFDAPMLLLYYTAIIVLLMIITLIVKLLCNDDEARLREETRANETSKLWLTSQEIMSNIYGTFDHIKSGKGSCSNSLSEDEKECLICYDDPRSCFFVPCRHCVTCYTCTLRIVNQETRACPICRSRINKVGKL